MDIRLQLLALVENIPLKNSMRRAKKWFFIILATAASGMPEICFLPGQLRWTILPKERYGDSLSAGESDTQPSSWEVDTVPLSYRRPREIFVANAHGVRLCYDVQWWRYWATKDTRKRIKLALTIYRDFMQNLFIIFWEAGQRILNCELPEFCLLVRGRMASLSFVQRAFDWDGGSNFRWSGRCGDWGTIAPPVSVLKSLNFETNTGVL